MPWHPAHRRGLSTPLRASLWPLTRGVGLLLALVGPARAATLSINDVSLVERNVSSTTLSLTVTLSSPLTTTATVNFTIADGTATSGIDYDWQAPPYYTSTGLVTFAPGETVKTIGLRVLGDTIRERDETVLVTLSSPVNATLADAQGIATIVDDDHSWSATGAMISPRYNHTATLLPDGRVFVAGGWGGTALATPAAELYDPGSGTWRAAGSLRYSRYGHTATWLPTGRLLLVGGSYAATRTELYDPLTDSSTETGSLGAGRYDHTATLLQSGKVLVAGGGSTSSPLSSAELYDPATGTWAATGSLSGRTQHSATRLLNGKVLVAGGLNAGVAIASAQLYDPATGTWTTTGSLPGAMFGHTATLLADGKVVVAGGTTGASLGLATVYRYDPGTGLWSTLANLTVQRFSHIGALLPSGRILVAGGFSTGLNLGDLVDAELFDPVAGSWATGGTLAVGRSRGVTATLLADGRVLVCGGIQGAATLASAEVYDARPLASAASGALVTRRIEHGEALLPNGTVLIAGGLASDNTSLLASAETYDPASGTWTATGNLGTARRSPTLTLLENGKVLVVGGEGASPNTALSEVELYDPVTRTFTAAAPLTQPRYAHTATPLADGRVLVVGGTTTNQGILPSAEIYDPTTGQWTFIASIEAFPSHNRTQHTATLLHSGKVLVAGGCGTGTSASARLYDPLSGGWTSAGMLPTGYCQHRSVLLRDGRVLVVGGLDGGGRTSATLYDPATGTWAETGALTYARLFHSATLLLDGRVLVIGNADVPTSEVYDPTAGAWTETGLSSARLNAHSATLLPDGRVLVAGGSAPSVGFASNAEVITYGNELASRRPVITSTSGTLTSGGVPFTVTGTGFGGDSEASGGRTSHSSTAHPLLEVRSLANGRTAWLDYDPLATFTANPATLSVSRFRPALDSGWYMASVVANGVRSVGKVVSGRCGMQIVQQPQPRTAAIGASATFSVGADGATEYQWRRDGQDIPGATAMSYTTPAIVAADAGTRFSVRVRGLCSTQTSVEATLTVQDSSPPTASVVSPAGGEYWLVSESGSPASTQVVTWSMSDDVRVCRVNVELRYSDDAGATYYAAPAGGGLPTSFGPGGVCAYPGEGTTSVLYTVPDTPPSGSTGSLYKVWVTVTDQAGNTRVAQSANPFYIVQGNPDSVRTLILKNTARMQTRMGISAAQATALDGKLLELAANPKVLGFVVDLNGVTDVGELYAAWDADGTNGNKANNVLFGCHGTPGAPAGCPQDRDRNGVHDLLTSLTRVYTGVRYVVLVGDDRIVPFARVADHTSLLPESSYTAGSVDLTPTGTTVGQALAANKYLSDDPLVVLDAVGADQLSGNLYLPDLAVGRLVETPAEITTTVATFISQSGVLDLSALPPGGNKVLVTGYDFLLPAANAIAEGWSSALGVSTPYAPVNASLVGGNWDDAALRSNLSGSVNGGRRYGLMSLNGHATHYAEGAPAAGDFRFGLKSQDLYGVDACATPSAGSVNLAGGVVYAVGCHGGLPVPGSCASNADHSLDLPQTFLARGAVAYVANSGYGWGLKSGIGYSARLVKGFTEELVKGGTVVVGDAVKSAKQKYYLATPRYDAYDEKSLMEWTVFGLPMYAVNTGIAVGASAPSAASVSGKTRALLAGATVEQVGAATVTREPAAALATPQPAYLTQVNLHFDFTAAGVYQKRNSVGQTEVASGCADPSGCYYELNGLSTGQTDLPVQPYFIYDSRLSGTSQHGVLWKGGTYAQESGWHPVIAELQSNGGDGSDHGSLPKVIKSRPIAGRVTPGLDPESCRTSDLELNSSVIDAGEVVQAPGDVGTEYSIERHYLTVELEALYFNDTVDTANNCDREGPVIGTGPHGGSYHQALPAAIQWSVPVSDASGVWRVVVVMTDNTVDGQGRGTWTPVELTDGGSGAWAGSAPATSTSVTYVIEAVDRRGNVSWLSYQGAQLPASGVALGVPAAQEAVVPAFLSAVSINSVSVAEGDAGSSAMTFTLSLSAATNQTVTVDYATAGGTAAPGGDYVSQSGTLVFPPLVTSQTIEVSVKGDTLNEPDETLVVNLTNPTNAALEVAQGTGTIIDDDASPTLSINDAVVREGAGGPVSAFFAVRLSARSGRTVTVDYATADGTALAGTDYTGDSGTLIFPPGTLTQYVEVPVLVDETLESTRDFYVDLSSPSDASLGKSRGQGWIMDTAAGQAVQFSAARYSVSEGAASGAVTVKRTGGATGTATVGYATLDGTAVSGVAYQPVSDTLTFAPGAVSKTFAVPMINDTGHDPSEAVLLRLTRPAGAALGAQSTAVLTRLDNDVAGKLAFSLTSYPVKVGAGQALITVKRTLGGASGVTVDYATGVGTATEGVDYTAKSGTLSFGAGTTSQTFTVPVLDDDTVKGDLTVPLVLSNPTGGASLGGATSTLVIQGDDPQVSFSAASYKAAVTTASALITVRRTGPTGAPMTVDYLASDGTAQVGEDYAPASGPLTFNPGVTSQTFKVAILNDHAAAPSETVNLTLGNPQGGALGLVSHAVLTLLSDDPVIQFSAPAYKVTETAGKVTLTVTRGAPTSAPVTVSYTTVDGTATEGEDYAPTAGSLVFPAGVTSKTITVLLMRDADHVTGETFGVVLSGPTGGAILGARSTATVTVVDADQAGTVQFSAADWSVSETGPWVLVTLSRTGGSAAGASVDWATSDGTGVAGTHYTSSGGTVVFGSGEGSKIILVPVLDDGVASGSHTVHLTLGNPGGGAVVGAQATATLWIVENR